MGLLSDQIDELNEMNKKVIAKDISTKEVTSRISIYSQVEKRARLMLLKQALLTKSGGPPFLTQL